MLTLVLVVVAAALIFEYINGFHDTANSIATVVATKVLSPMQAVMLAAYLCQRIAHQAQEITVGVEDGAVGLELDKRHRTVECRQRGRRVSQLQLAVRECLLEVGIEHGSLGS